MKKIYTYWMMALMMATLTACEDYDAEEARTLDGTWTGYVETYYRDRFHVSGSSYRTTMYFEQTGRYRGVGYEVDYDRNNPYSGSYYSDFAWEVYNGQIRIDYADSWDPVYIYDYSLSSNYFSGYMDDGSNRDIYFQLSYDQNFNWNPYRTGRYYAPTRGAGNDDGEDVVRGDGYYATGIFAKALRERDADRQQQ